MDFGIGTVFNEYLNNSTTLYGHANAQGVVGVGAASFLQTPTFGVNPPLVENFSSLGGTPIIFDTAGNRLGTPLVRQKPDVVGPDGGNTTFFGTDIVGDADAFLNFFGTSQAAPHVAGLAALMLDAAPTLTPTQVGQLLSFTTVDMDDPVAAGFQTGFDFATGTGLVNGVSAMNATRVSQGDYNSNGAVDAADYVLWRKNQGNTVANFTSPDGSGNGNIGSEDYTVWRSHFGQAFPVPGAGSGSSVSGAALASASESVEESASPPAIAQNLSTETTAVASADFNAADLRLFRATMAPSGTAIISRPTIGERRSALVNIAVRNDEGLLAWLSDHSVQRPNSYSDSDSGDDHNDFFADHRDHYSDVPDNAFESCGPAIRSSHNSLVAAG